jgi:glycosyltransferase involved in cell wall biosynthesis
MKRGRRYSYCVNGKWLAQSPSGTQRYASQVMESLSLADRAADVLVILPRDAVEPAWLERFPTTRSRWSGTLFEQVALPWLSRGTHLFSMAGPAPLAKRDQTMVMHDAMPFRYPKTFRKIVAVWYRVMYGLLSRTAKRVLTVSEFSRGELADTLRVSRGRFELAPCAPSHLDDGVGGSKSYEPPFLPGTFALIVGNLAPHKNVAPTATALAEAGIPVAVVGMEQGLFRGVVGIEGSANLRPLGRVDDHELQQLYRSAAVLVAPSRYEGFGIPIIEAGVEGCPAVFALGSAMTEVAGDAGIGFDPDDLLECVTQVRKVIGDSQLRADLSAGARVNAARFSWDNTAQVIFGSLTAHGDGRPVRVLHVTETFSAGTGTAVVEYAHAAKRGGVQSFLLANDRGSGLLDELGDNTPFVNASIVGPGLLKLWKALPTVVAEVRPDVVHLHSSLAGVVGRLSPPLSGNPRIVYSPHCFAFERRDISLGRRWLYRIAEWALARRTHAFIGVSPHEVELAQALRSSADVGYVLNSFTENRALQTVQHAEPVTSVDPDRPISIVTVGRIAPQKSPEFFLDIVSRFPDRLGATWVGDGQDKARSVLERAGVRVTGWLPAADVPEAIVGHTVYLHTAGWEASVPIAVLDAVQVGLPVVVRRNPAYRGILPDDWQFDDVSSAAALIRELAQPGQRARRVAEQHMMIARMAEHSPDVVLADRYRQIASIGSTGIRCKEKTK